MSSPEGRDWFSQFIRATGLRALTVPVTALLSIISATVAVRYAGVDAYGFVSLVAQLTLLIPFADLGLGAVVTRTVAQARAGSTPMARAVGQVRQTMLILSGIGLTAAVVVLLVGIEGGWGQLFAAPPAIAAGVNATTTITLIVFLGLLPLAVSQRVLVGLDRGPTLVILGLIPPATNLLFIVVASALGAPALALALGTSLGSVAAVASFALFAFSPRLGGINLSRKSNEDLQAPSVFEIIRSGAPMLVTGIGTALTIQSGRIVLANASTDIALTEYSLAFQLYLPLFSILYMASTVLWPRFSVSLDKRMWRIANLALSGLGVLAGLGFVLVGPLLVRLMSDSAVHLTPALATSFAMLLTVQGLNATQAMLLTDHRGLTTQAVCSVLCATSVIVASILLSPSLGATAPALSAAIGILVTTTAPCLLIAWKRVRR